MQCWNTKSLFQMALILILIVAVPFFIALLLIYIMYGVIWRDSEQCRKLCSVLALQD